MAENLMPEFNQQRGLRYLVPEGQNSVAVTKNRDAVNGRPLMNAVEGKGFRFCSASRVLGVGRSTRN